MTSNLKTDQKRSKAENGQAIDYFKQLKENFDKIFLLAKNSRDPELVQIQIRKLDTLLKDLSDLDLFLKQQKKILQEHCKTLRQSSPKVRLSEGEKVVIDGVSYLHIKSYLYEIKSHTDRTDDE